MTRLPKSRPSNTWTGHAWMTVLLTAVLLAASGCTRHDKAEQLAALDNVYRAGLLTKEEYDAKKLALTGIATAPASAIPAVTTSASPSPSPAVAAPRKTPPPVITH